MAKSKPKRKRKYITNKFQSGFRSYKSFKPGDYVILQEQVEFMDPGLYRFDGKVNNLAFFSIGDAMMTSDVDTLDKCKKHRDEVTHDEISKRFDEHMKCFNSWQGAPSLINFEGIKNFINDGFLT
ncbi:MAG: hypothetical protein IT292_12585 [Deltaproteobacteria bacterium]|nr:hypothetical protein [Deltaproteobacteria bacterium]